MAWFLLLNVVYLLYAILKGRWHYLLALLGFDAIVLVLGWWAAREANRDRYKEEAQRIRRMSDMELVLLRRLLDEEEKVRAKSLKHYPYL